jgi:Family of unknown function (DUF5752)
MSQITPKQKPNASEADILRALSDDKAFYFYSAMNTPLGVKANNLEEFAEKLSNVDASSVEFHVKRHDFENWIKMLGDPTLAGQIMTIGSQSLPPSQSKELLVKAVRQRLSDIKSRK